MNSMERTLTALSFREPDRVPLFLLLSLYGARELQMPVKDYFTDPETVAFAQLSMQKKYRSDCLDTFYYAPIEIEAFGGEVVFVDNGPPNSGEPFIRSYDQIVSLTPPDIGKADCLQKVLRTTALLKQEVKNTVPIIGVVMSPYSLPVMQMGFDKYIEMLYYRKDDFARLMRINEEFCVAWANAQLAAGATAICYFDPLASPAIIERKLYLETGFQVAKRTISRIKGPTATHLASGITLPVIDDIAATGTAVLGFSAQDDLAEVKRAADHKLCLLGNLNAIEMVHWNAARVDLEVRNAIAQAGKGGGFILSDNHGEIPWQVPESVLLAISEAVQKYGSYPIRRDSYE